MCTGVEIALIAGAVASTAVSVSQATKSGPKPPAALPEPAREDPEVEAASEAEKALRRRRGRQQTILTTGLGDLDDPLVARPTLGG